MVDITIAIPTLNSGATLGMTLESLRSLGSMARVILVDSHSSDQTLEIAKLFSIEIRTCPPGNLYEAVNVGLSDTDTEWVTYLNSDDVMYANTLATRIEGLRSAPIDISYGAVDFIDGDGRFLRSWKPARETALLPLYQAGYSAMLQQGTLIRRELFEKLGGFSTKYRYVADADFWFRALEAGARFHCDKSTTVAAFRLHRAQITQQKKIEMQAEHRAMVRDHGGQKSSLAAKAEFMRWRLRNAGSYVERWHRAHRIGACKVFCGSYDLP